MRTLTKSIISISLTGFLFLGACGDDGGGGTGDIDAATPPPDGATAPDATAPDPAAELWNAISDANDYTQWAEFPGLEGVVAYSGHGTTHRRAFVNDVAAGDLAGMPDGSIIIKENLTANDPTALAAITVMQKQGNDWYWAAFQPDGTVDVAGTTAELASAGCVAAACHGDLLGSKDDSVFLNNEAQDAALVYAQITDAADLYTAWPGLGAVTAPDLVADTSGVHGAFNRTFINPTGDANERNLAEGTILVKENFTANDATTLDAITVMPKQAGIDAANDDWLYIKLSADGKVQLAGTLGANNVGCATGGCHETAGGNDFVFGN